MNPTSFATAKSYRIIYTPSEFAKENLFYLQEAGYLKSINNHIKQRDRLNSYLFLIVLSGSGCITYKDSVYELCYGDFILINCNNHYSQQSSLEDPWELMWVHFNGTNMAPYIRQYENEHPEVVLHTEFDSEFTTIIDCCMELGNKKDISSEFHISKLLTDLMTICITKVKREINYHNIEKMHSIKEYIDQNFQNKISLSSIAEEFFLSKYYLAREFKKHYGLTIGDYTCSKRITYSKELLRFTSKSIEEISALCGIPDVNYFAKVFRKLEECSPTEYRKKW